MSKKGSHLATRSWANMAALEWRNVFRIVSAIPTCNPNMASSTRRRATLPYLEGAHNGPREARPLGRASREPHLLKGRSSECHQSVIRDVSSEHHRSVIIERHRSVIRASSERHQSVIRQRVRTVRATVESRRAPLGRCIGSSSAAMGPSAWPRAPRRRRFVKCGARQSSRTPCVRGRASRA